MSNLLTIAGNRQIIGLTEACDLNLMLDIIANKKRAVAPSNKDTIMATFVTSANLIGAKMKKPALGPADFLGKHNGEHRYQYNNYITP